MTEQPTEAKELALENLKDAVRSAAALRLRVKLNSAGGVGDKVFPPTYAGGVYAVEDRRIEGDVVRCALLDSVQSQANRMEGALLDAFLPAWRELDPNQPVNCELPLLALKVDGHGWVNSLTAPHRVHDAILRDSEVADKSNTDNGTRVRFRESTIGQKIVKARLHKATGLYQHCPTALIFGTWDSTAGEGLDSTKIPRAVVSEIIGVDITSGVRTASRIDPLGIRAQSATVYRLKDHEDDWTLHESEAAKTDKGEPKKFGKKGKPSDINHGNVTPDMPRFSGDEIRKQNLDKLTDILESTPVQLRYELSSGNGRIDSHASFRSDEVRVRSGAVKPGGITMDYALHIWTLSFTQLRRLRFPLDSSGPESAAGGSAVTSEATNQNQTPQEQRNESARTVLAALALYALALLQEQGYWLRSRCELVLSQPAELDLIGGGKGTYSLKSSADIKTKLLDPAIKEAEAVGVTWSKNVTILKPTEKLMELVRLSDARGPEMESETQEAADVDAPS